MKKGVIQKFSSHFFVHILTFHLSSEERGSCSSPDNKELTVLLSDIDIGSILISDRDKNRHSGSQSPSVEAFRYSFLRIRSISSFRSLLPSSVMGTSNSYRRFHLLINAQLKTVVSLSGAMSYRIPDERITILILQTDACFFNASCPEESMSQSGADMAEPLKNGHGHYRNPANGILHSIIMEYIDIPSGDMIFTGISDEHRCCDNFQSERLPGQIPEAVFKGNHISWQVRLGAVAVYNSTRSHVLPCFWISEASCTGSHISWRVCFVAVTLAGHRSCRVLGCRKHTGRRYGNRSSHINGKQC